MITAGYSQALGTHAIGGQMKALTGNAFDLASFASNHPTTALFHGHSFLIVLAKKADVSTFLPLEKIWTNLND